MPTATPGDERHATPPRPQATDTPVSATTGMSAFGDGGGMMGTVSVYVSLCVSVTKHLALDKRCVQ